MGIYDQLNRLAVRFPVKINQVTIPATSSAKLLDNSNCRTYFAFTYLTTANPITFSPVPVSVSGNGYPSQGNSQIFEQWIDRHMSLVQSAWYCFNATAGPVTITTIEVIYSDREEDYETLVNPGE